MKRIVYSSLIGFLGFGVVVLASGQTSHDTSRGLAAFAGSWDYEGSGLITPMPGTRISGLGASQVAAGGFVLQTTGTETGIFGTVEWGETAVYDAAKKRVRYLGSQSDGTVWQGSGFGTDRVWKYEGTLTTRGTTYHLRSEKTFATDLRSYVWKTEVRVDEVIRVRGMGGLFHAWKPWFETRATKRP